jgi:hypothetical protein
MEAALGVVPYCVASWVGPFLSSVFLLLSFFRPPAFHSYPRQSDVT